MARIEEDEIVALAAQLGARLASSALTVTTAESCTGGWVAQAITSIGGSSAWFERGFITYSDEAKQALLGVPAATLAAHGAVSEETALAMAQGAQRAANAALAVAVTGIAGPSGGTPKKPVGLVWFGLCARGAAPSAVRRVFAGERREIRAQAVLFALQQLLELSAAPNPT